MIKPQFLEQVEDYLERYCFDKRWFEYREKLGKPIDLRKIEQTKDFMAQIESDSGRTSKTDKILIEHVRNLQENSLFSKRLGADPLPLTDAERAKALETHRNYFANYLFDLMVQKNLSEAEVASKAHMDAAIFSRLRDDRKYIPKERTIWALVLGMGLNLAEANSLMERVKFYLAGNVMEEALMAFFLDNRIYDLDLANEILTHYGFEILDVKEDFTKPLNTKPAPDDYLIERIDLYIDKNFHEMPEANSDIKISISAGHLGEPAESLKTFEVIVRALKDKVGIAGNYFSDYLYKLIKRKNLTDVEVYKRAHLDRRIFSKIRNEKKYMPSKKTVMAIVFAMKLDFKEANTLLARAGYFLSDARKEDVITAYFIENQIYDLYLINEVLDYYNCPILGD